MANKRLRAVAAGSIVAVLLLSAGCGADESATSTASIRPTPSTAPPRGAPATPETAEETTTTQRAPAATVTTTTTTTVPVAGEGTPPTAPTIPDDDGVPETFMLHFEESYVCQLGPAGASEIHASGAIAAGLDPSHVGDAVLGEGDLGVTGVVRGGDICTGEAVGTHRVGELNGTIDVPDEGAPTLTLHVTGTWYDTWDGEITCAGGLPPSGPWNWPQEFNIETLVFSPFEDGATWEKDVSMGLCQGTVTRTIEF